MVVKRKHFTFSINIFMVTKLRFYREANVTGCRNTVLRYPSINAQQVEERPDVSNVSLVQCPNNSNGPPARFLYPVLSSFFTKF